MKKIILIIGIFLLFRISIIMIEAQNQSSEPLKQEIITEEQKQKLETYLKEMEEIAKSTEEQYKFQVKVGERKSNTNIFQMGKSAVPILIDELKDKTKDWKYRYEILLILEFIKDPNIVDSLIKIIEDSNDVGNIRARSIFILGFLKVDKCIDLFISLLSDNYRDIRICSAIALGELKDKRAIDPMLKQLSVEINPLVRSYLLKGLSDIGDKRVIEQVKWRLKNDLEGSVRCAAAAALAKIAGKDAFDPIVESLEDDPIHRIQMLDYIGDLRAVPVLINLLGNKNRLVVQLSVSVLGNFKDRRAIVPLETLLSNSKNDALKKIITDALKKIKE